jgi:hypothetical protein
LFVKTTPERNAGINNLLGEAKLGFVLCNR